MRRDFVAGLVITLEGSPEHVQRIADAIEVVLPGAVDWHDGAVASLAPGRVTIKGLGLQTMLRMVKDDLRWSA